MKRLEFGFAEIFCDNVVLQREMPIPVFGFGPEGEEVAVALCGKTARARIRNGKWTAWLPAAEAAEGLTLTADCCGGRLAVENVAIGEVWIAGGQSNMQFFLRNEAGGREAVESADDSGFRYFDVPRISYEGEEREVPFDDYGFWRPFLPQHAGWFSAAAAYFGRELRRTLGVPVGIVGCNWGGTSASCWMDEEYLDEKPELRCYREVYEQGLCGLDMEEYRRKFVEKQKYGMSPAVQRVSDGLESGEIPAEEAMNAIKQLPPERRELFMLPVGPLDPTRPCALYHYMVETVAPYAARGVIWYQGESDDVFPDLYDILFTQLIRCWRAAWGRELPFLFVQLAPYGQWMGGNGNGFPELRRRQELVSKSLPGVWMASIMDEGMENDIHPKRKRPVGERLALLARGRIYGETDLPCEPPELAGAEAGTDKIILHFNNTADGLECRGERVEGLVLRRSEEPAGAAEPGGGDLSFEARAERDSLILRLPAPLSGRITVSYLQQPYVKANLYNSAGLCAKPFRTEVRLL